MPTAAQRQRAAAQRQRAAAAATASLSGATAASSSSAATTSNYTKGQIQRLPGHKQRLQQQQQQQSQLERMPSKQQQQQHHLSTTQSKNESSEEGAFSDEENEEDETAIAFEMDSQDLWTQNFCATCDCLIEPGQGVRPATRKRRENDDPRAPTSPMSSRQALPSTGLGRSKTGTIKARPISSEGSNNMKRTHSAGKLHAAGGAGVLGPHKRTGSAAGRLNALSELRPTTKLNDNESNNRSTRSDQSTKKSASLPRHDSESSGQSPNSSRANSPISPNTNLPRTRKSGLIVASNARRLEEEAEQMNAKAPAALYCSDRCRSIDEQRNSELGELVYYLHQPAPTSPIWTTGANLGMGNSYSSWSNRALNMGYRDRSSAGTPESECTCIDCMDKHSVEGAAPSGASDTTESSASYQYGGRNKQRTQSGRIITPQNLAAPAGHGTDYFGWAANRKGSHHHHHHQQQQQQQQQQQMKQKTRRSDGMNLSDESVIGIYTAERNHRDEVEKVERISPSIISPRTLRDRGASIASDDAYGSTTAGTVTPATNTHSPNRLSGSPDLPNLQGISISQSSATASPLRLIGRGDLHAQASVDVSSDLAKSQQTYPSSLLSRSIASEQTEMAASSGITLSSHKRTQSPFVNYQQPRPSSLLVGERRKEIGDNQMQPIRMTNSPMPIESGDSSSAIGTLKNAQIRAMQDDAMQCKSNERRQSVASTTSSSGSWLRASISSAWNSIRGYPPSGTNSSDDFSSVDDHHGGSRRNSSSSSAASRFSAILPHGLGAMTPIAATNQDDPTPIQSQIARPHIKRGKIPAFASEIGQGKIPGEADDVKMYSASQEMPSQYSKSQASSTHYSSDEERRRRKLEREKKQRHQRSKDVTVLPPLLGVSRTSSSANLSSRSSRPSHYTHASFGSSSTNYDVMNISRSRAGIQSQGLIAAPSMHIVGSFGSTNGMSRPITPGFRKNSSSTTTLAAPELAGSPSGRMINIGSFGTSPRRAGLGWGAMSTIASPDTSQLSNIISRPPSHASQRQQQHHHGHHHNHHHHHHHQHSSSKTPQSCTLNGNQQQRHTNRHSAGTGGSSNNLMRLGNIGLLGSHPHGHGPIYGRHATTPVRSTTPRVPEEGGEMSGAALKGEEEEEDEGNLTLQGANLHPPDYLRASNLNAHPPARPHSSMSGHGFVSAADYSQSAKRSSTGLTSLRQARNMSSDDVRPMKLYPVLDVPNRKPTHDFYDANWHLDGAQKVLAEGQVTQQRNTSERTAAAVKDNQSKESESQSQRKRLFYFDTT